MFSSLSPHVKPKQFFLDDHTSHLRHCVIQPSFKICREGWGGWRRWVRTECKWAPEAKDGGLMHLGKCAETQNMPCARPTSNMQLSPCIIPGPSGTSARVFKPSTVSEQEVIWGFWQPPLPLSKRIAPLWTHDILRSSVTVTAICYWLQTSLWPDSNAALSRTEPTQPPQQHPPYILLKLGRFQAGNVRVCLLDTT